MQGIGNRPCFFISDGVSFVRRQVFGFSLNVVKLADVFQGLCCKLTLVGLMQVVELTAGMSQAPDFGDAVAEARFIAGVIVADQFALPAFQEGSSVLTRPGWSEDVNNSLQIRERCGAIGPDVGFVGFLLARSQHTDRCFIDGELCQFRFNSGQIAVDPFIQQVALNRIQLFAALGELMALQNGQLMGQLFDDRIAVHQRSIFQVQCLFLGFQGRHQLRCQGTELIGRELVKIGVL